MTYNELRDYLNKLTPERLEQNVTIEFNDEEYPATIMIDTDGQVIIVEEIEELELEPQDNRKMTRQEFLQGLADRGIDTWSDYRGER